MKYLSVCSGIEAATVAWSPIGFQPVAFSEIELFACALLSEYYPSVPNLGDMTRFEEWNIEQPDILVGGTPCQSFSVAGGRGGIDDPRGALMLVYLAIARRYNPRFIVWENVPGVLSSNEGRDFGTFLRELGKLGYGFAYRVLDAQFVRVESHARAVPQRRRRVFVVGYSGNVGRSTDAPTVQDLRRFSLVSAAVLFESASLQGYPPPSREAGARVADPITRAFARHRGASAGKDSTPRNMITVAQTLRAKGNLAHREDADTLVAATFGSQLSKQSNSPENRSNPHTGGVRRLTVTECERLMGFPDDYTAITYRGKAATDSPRCRALGNSMAVNVMYFIGERIMKVQGVIDGKID